jgi:anthranilate phosphoribosyltransferase
MPEELGLQRVDRAVLASESVAASVERATAVLGGEGGPAREVVLLNAAGTLLAADVVRSFGEGVDVAARSIDSGAAAGKLEALRSLSQRLKARAQEVPT